MFVLPFIVTHF